MTEDEWSRVGTLLALLGKAEYAQQSFSLDCGPAIHLALPGLESLHKAWDTRSTKAEYIEFWPGLEAGVSKIAEYYQKTAGSDVYVLAMRRSIMLQCRDIITSFAVLDPVQKANHIRKFWGHHMYDEVIQHAEELVCV